MTSLVSEIVDSDQPAGNSDKLLTQVFSVLTAQFDAVASSVGVWAVAAVQTGQFESVASSEGVWGDPIPTWLLKECIDLLAPFITKIINNSLTTGCVPAAFKKAYITPLVKKPGSGEDDASNFRPVSNLSVLSKTLERAVSRQLERHVNSAGLFPSHQSAYRRHHSTEIVLLRVCSDIITHLDKGECALEVHLYSDDSQMYVFSRPHATEPADERLLHCLDSARWMQSNRLRLNPSKTQFMRCATARRLTQLSNSPITFCGEQIIGEVSSQSWHYCGLFSQFHMSTV